MQTKSPIIDQSRKMDEKAWWDLWNTSYRTEIDTDPIPSELFARTAAVVNEITRTGTGRLLEIACGTGVFSRLLVYSEYRGLDISPAAIELAREKSGGIALPSGASQPIYEAADFHEWNLPQEPFDVAVCVDAVMCFRDQQFALKKMAQSLRVGGRLVITAINPFVYNRIARTAAAPLQVGPVNRWLSRRELHDLIQAAGLTIERSFTIMPRGNSGILRLINARRLNDAFGPRAASALKRMKETCGLGQYRVVVARKESVSASL